MFAYVRHVAGRWALLSLLLFAVSFWAVWIFGSAGGWNAESSWLLILFSAQIAFAAAVFAHKKQMTAGASLLALLAVLFACALIVPYLATLISLDAINMGETISEVALALGLLASGLSAGWLLPNPWRRLWRGIFALAVLLYILVRFVYIGYFEVSGALVSENMLLALAQTNTEETLEFIEVNLPYAALFFGVFLLLGIVFFFFRLSTYCFANPFRLAAEEKVFLGFFVALNFLCVGISNSGTLFSTAVWKAHETLLSFVEYQMIVSDHKNRNIKDPAILEKLAAVPDGVYVLVIGESLNRDHMNVYGYPRENTPFQSAAAWDYHFTFFDRAYACYTQTVHVLTYALTEKNQYNDMKLSDAFSLVDMARAAGFKTTWISNQSRYGVWDTPIGAIGSVCDEQYWVNEYIGTKVITKDYDEALVPYLEKVDPENRRQLIIVHLMGSHISYWDRYPKEYYRYPIDCDRQRTKEEIMTDEYDNTVYYNDEVLRRLTEVAVDRLDADGILYFSDHGDKVCERPGHNADMFDFAMVHVPLWTYTSDRYIAMHPETYEMMRVRRHTAFTNDMIYDTMLGFMGIDAVHYDPGCDLFGAFDKLPGMLMTMHGNIWLDKDEEGLGDWEGKLAELRFPEDGYE